MSSQHTAYTQKVFDRNYFLSASILSYIFGTERFNSGLALQRVPEHQEILDPQLYQAAEGSCGQGKPAKVLWDPSSGAALSLGPLSKYSLLSQPVDQRLPSSSPFPDAIQSKCQCSFQSLGITSVLSKWQMGLIIPIVPENC